MGVCVWGEGEDQSLLEQPVGGAHLFTASLLWQANQQTELQSMDTSITSQKDFKVRTLGALGSPIHPLHAYHSLTNAPSFPSPCFQSVGSAIPISLSVSSAATAVLKHVESAASRNIPCLGSSIQVVTSRTLHFIVYSPCHLPVP